MRKITKRMLVAACAAVICGALVTLGAVDRGRADGEKAAQTAQQTMAQQSATTTTTAATGTTTTGQTTQTTADSASGSQTTSQQYAYIPNRSVYFYDVDAKYDWAYREIDYLATLNVARGTDQYLFNPNESLTRADFILMLYRAYDMSSYASGQYFKDVQPGTYYADAVLAARKLGIAKGVNGYFYPKQTITRQDAMVLLERTLTTAGVKLSAGSTSSYHDAAAITSYATSAIGKLTQAGIISGAEGKVNPTGAVSRAQMAVMLYRALMLEDDASGLPRYVDHPERVNLCIGGKIYSGTTISNYDSSKTYTGLFSYTDFQQTDKGHCVTLGTQAALNQKITYANGVLTVDGQQMKVAKDCVGVRVSPYSTLSSLTSTGTEYTNGRVSVNTDGEVNIIYYSK